MSLNLLNKEGSLSALTKTLFDKSSDDNKDMNGKKCFPKGYFDISHQHALTLPKKKLSGQMFDVCLIMFIAVWVLTEKYFFYTCYKILMQTIQVQLVIDMSSVNKDRIVDIEIPLFDVKNNAFLDTETVKGIVSILGDDDVEFWDYGYEDSAYPSKGQERLMTSDFTGTSFTEVTKNLKSNMYSVSETFWNIHCIFTCV